MNFSLAFIMLSFFFQRRMFLYLIVVLKRSNYVLILVCSSAIFVTKFLVVSFVEVDRGLFLEFWCDNLLFRDLFARDERSIFISVLLYAKSDFCKLLP